MIMFWTLYLKIHSLLIPSFDYKQVESAKNRKTESKQAESTIFCGDINLGLTPPPPGVLIYTSHGEVQMRPNFLHLMKSH